MCKEFSCSTLENKGDLTLPDLLLEKRNQHTGGNNTGRQKLKNPTFYIGNHYINSAVNYYGKIQLFLLRAFFMHMLKTAAILSF